MSAKTILTGLKADAFRHPLDQEATRTLRQLPGLDVLLRTAIGPIAEQVFYLENISASVLVGERQLPHLHELLQDACRILDLDPPQLYVRQHPVPNAYTFAMRGKQPFVVVHTSLLDLLTPPEIQAVIGHELGHLKCDHSVYLTLANLLTLAASQLPWGEVLAQGLQSQIMEWVRCAEFTCDRAALLVTQDARIVASLLMKLCGGSPSLAPQLNLDAFLEQARAYNVASATTLGDVVKQFRNQNLTHPLPVLRAKEIDHWAQSSDYQMLLQSGISQYNNETQSKGGWRNW
ncbi:M48 family metallopeptidase [Leptolyngbya sp. PCC 6406]|uniref:M48 family metallopeptidase n=1 Tax=Leptolyngbya sp. PCC 6406 TaxID=1173264 RepID=UPI000481692C|nr:M48 family metallopeptidase [Leptolyngbya sp. PCC 6406]